MEIGLSSARLEVRCSLASQEKRGREQWCVFLFTRLDNNDIVDIHFWDTISETSGIFTLLFLPDDSLSTAVVKGQCTE